jgi:Ca2+-binding RTX toxin-like protein
VINHGKIAGNTHLGRGDDLFNGGGGKSGPVFGDDCNDRLIGGSKNDQLHLGDGSDKLTGGLGADQFFFDSGANGSVDKITDFTPSQHDKLVLSAASFLGITPVGGTLDASEFHVGSTAATPNQHILYTPGNGFLFYDQDGSGTTDAPIHFATLSTHPTIGPGAILVEAWRPRAMTTADDGRACRLLLSNNVPVCARPIKQSPRARRLRLTDATLPFGSVPCD